MFLFINDIVMVRIYMNFLEYIDNTYSAKLKKFDIDAESEEFSCFIPIEPLNYSTKNKFLIRKQKLSRLFIVVGKQRIYLSDVNIIKTILDLDIDEIRWFIKQLCDLYVSDNNTCSFRINEEEFNSCGIEYFANDKELLLYTDTLININDFIFVINFVLAKDSVWGEMKELNNFRKLTICKYISLIAYYAFESKDAKLFLKAIGYPIENRFPQDNKEISQLFNNENIEKFDISLFV